MSYECFEVRKEKEREKERGRGKLVEELMMTVPMVFLAPTIQREREDYYG